MTTKVVVSLPDELVETARAAVREGRAASLSEYVADALREKSGRYSLGEVLDALDAELGAPGPDVMAQVDRELDRVLGPAESSKA